MDSLSLVWYIPGDPDFSRDRRSSDEGVNPGTDRCLVDRDVTEQSCADDIWS
jgi:hypothetical protein